MSRGTATSLAVLGLAATVGLSTTPVQAQVSFAAPQNFATGSNPASVTVGDLDGDGDLDLATANYSSRDISVLKNNGDGTFAAPQSFAIEGYGPVSITVGDLDGDGDLDLATANRGSYDISVLKNNGNGTFATTQIFDIANGDVPTSITVGDLDADGDLDLVVGTFILNVDQFAATSYVSVVKNNGDGTFAAPENYDAGLSPSSITVGDLDGDGDLDLAVALSGYDDYYYFSVPGGFNTLKNNGDGTFVVGGGRGFPYNRSGRSITVGDLDGDGDLDLATTSGQYNSTNSPPGATSVFKNNGDGTFAVTQTYSSEGNPGFITAGDLDGDNDLDLVVANYSDNGGVSVLKNNGNGTFATAQTFVAGYNPYSIAIGDLDKDGDLDLATNHVTVLESTTPTLQLSPSPSRTNPTPLAGASVSGNIYVFASGKDSDFLRVRFFLDDPDRSGESLRTELLAPFDFASGTVSTANVFDTTTLTNGEHTITATFARTDGTYRTITSIFTVGN